MLTLLALLLLAVGVEAKSGGPDPFGYVYADSDQKFGPDYDFTTIIGEPGTTAVTLGDDATMTTPAPINFPFVFYGYTYSDVFINSNGFLSFGQGWTYSWGSDIQYSWTPNNIIAPFWADLNPACGGDIGYRTDGPPGKRIFTAEYNAIEMYAWAGCGTTAENTFQVKLFEETREIHFIYESVDSENSWTAIGIEHPLGSMRLLHGYQIYAMDDFSIRFFFGKHPVANNDFPKVWEDSKNNPLDPLANDSEPEGQAIEVTVLGSPFLGAASISGSAPDQKVLYTPDQDKNSDSSGWDWFTYTIEDSTGLARTAWIAVDIDPVNDAPSFQLKESLITVLEDAGTQNIPAFSYDLKKGPTWDENPQTVTYHMVTANPALFTVPPNVDPNGKLNFKTAPHQVGSSEVEIWATDNGGVANGGTDTSEKQAFTITVTPVNDPPSFVYEPVLNIQEDAGDVVLEHVTSIMGGPATAADEVGQNVVLKTDSLTVPAVFENVPKLASDGTLTLSTKPEQCDPTTPAVLKFYAEDDGGTADGGKDKSDVVELKIFVDCVNDAPIAHDDGVYQLAANTMTPLPLLVNDIVWPDDVWPPGGDKLSLLPVPDAKHGSGVPSSDGTQLLFTPETDYTGEFTFEYTVQDLGGLTDTATVAVDVFCPSLTAVGDQYMVDEDGVLDIYQYWGVLANDENLADAPLEATVVQEPLKGTLALATDGGFVYTPDTDAFGPDLFRYEVADDTFCTDRATVLIDIIPKNDPPQAVDDLYTMAEDDPTKILDVLANDSPYPDVGEAMQISDFTKPGFGALKAVGQPIKHFLYTPPVDWNGVTSFTYTLTDATGASAVATVTIIVGAVDDPAGTVPDQYVVRPGRLVTIQARDGVLANDADAEGGTLQAFLYDAPRHGSLELRPDGGFSYMAPPGFLGTDAFSYRATDGGVLSSPTIVRIIVRAADPPIAAFEMSSDRVGIGATAGFFDLSHDPDGRIASWFWDLGVTTSTLQHPSHVYLEPGRHAITLTVVDEDGLTATTSQTLFVVDEYTLEEGGAADGSRPLATAGPDITVEEGETFTLAAETTVDVVAYHWSQRAGPEADVRGANTATLEGIAPMLRADQDEAVLIFHLIVYDGLRESDPAVVNVTVIPAAGLPVIRAAPDMLTIEGRPVEIPYFVEGFRRGTTPEVTVEQVGGAKVELEHDVGLVRFSAPDPSEGPVVLRFVAATEGEEATDEVNIALQPIEVLQGFVIEKSKSRDSSAVTFRPTVPGDVRWDFGDGSTSRLQTPTHYFPAAGTYRVTLQVADPAGAVRTFEQDVSVYAAAASEQEAPLGILLPTLGLLAVIALRRR